MPIDDKRNILRIGPPEHPGETEITPAMVESVRQRIKDAGGILTVWAVLHEDVYETQFGDGFYLHARGIALNSADAERSPRSAAAIRIRKMACQGLQARAERQCAGLHCRHGRTRKNSRSAISWCSSAKSRPAGPPRSCIRESGLRKDGPLLALP